MSAARCAERRKEALARLEERCRERRKADLEMFRAMKECDDPGKKQRDYEEDYQRLSFECKIRKSMDVLGEELRVCAIDNYGYSTSPTEAGEILTLKLDGIQLVEGGEKCDIVGRSKTAYLSHYSPEHVAAVMEVNEMVVDRMRDIRIAELGRAAARREALNE